MVANLTDQELLLRCRSGDLDAFGEIYTRYSRVVYRYAVRMLSDPDDADDVMQDTFVKAFRTLPGFRGDCSLLTWLLKITGNLCRDRYKMRTRRGDTVWLDQIGDLPDLSEHGADPADILERKDLKASVHRVLNAMPPAQKELIILRDFEGLSYQQIADIQETTLASVKLRLFRARKTLRDRMESLFRMRPSLPNRGML